MHVRISCAALAVICLSAPLSATASDQSYLSVRDLLAMDATTRTFYIEGVYDGINAVLVMRNKTACIAPPGTSIASVGSMITDQWRADRKSYVELQGAAGVLNAMCTLWPPHNDQPAK